MRAHLDRPDGDITATPFLRELMFLETLGISPGEAAKRISDIPGEYLNDHGELKSTVLSKDTKRLESQGFLEKIINPNFIKPDEYFELFKKVCRDKYADVQSALTKLGQGRFRELWVVPSNISGQNSKSENWPRGFGWYARNSVPVLQPLLARSNRTAVAFGTTVYWILFYLGKVTAVGPVSSQADVQIFPTSGRPAFQSLVPEDSTSLAALLARRLGQKTPALSLNHLSWSLDVRHEIEPELRRHQAEIAKDDTFAKIFGFPRGAPTSLLANADLLLTGAGVLDHNSRFWKSEIGRRGLSWSAIRHTGVVDIAGALLFPQGLEMEDKGWMGISIDEIRAIASRGKPGVVLTIFGENKNSVALRAIENGLVNILVCDDALIASLKGDLSGRVTR